MKTAIITGGNSGLGYEAAKALAREGGWHIIVTSRSAERASRAAREIATATGWDAVEGTALDLASLASVRAFAAAFMARTLPPLHSIVCNAGITLGDTLKSEDGFELTFATNHLGHFLLVNLLLPRLAAPGRVVFVSSGTHVPEDRLPRILGVPAPHYVNARALAYPEQAEPGARITHPRQRYSTSKLCNVLCAYELARRLEADGRGKEIGVFVLDPGLMPGTNFTREYPAAVRSAFTALVSRLAPMVPGIRLPEQSGRDLARLVTDPALAGKTALYFDGAHEARSSAESYDRVKAADLWETSAELVGLKAGEAQAAARV